MPEKRRAPGSFHVDRSERLAIFLDIAVPLRIMELQRQGGPLDTDFERARQTGFLIAEGANGKGADASATLLDGHFKGRKQDHEDAAKLMNEIAFALAVCAFLPGGVPEFLGRHWESERITKR